MGRHRRYTTNAERQKAYRERKNRRDSEGSAPEDTPTPSPVQSVSPEDAQDEVPAIMRTTGVAVGSEKRANISPAKQIAGILDRILEKRSDTTEERRRP